MEACRNRCVGCGSTDRLKVLLIVPLAAGGHLSVENGSVLCRTCEMAKEAAERTPRGEERRLVNFWVARKMHERIQEAIRTRDGFVSLGHLVRYMMTKYVEDPARYNDLERYQDHGPSEVRINVWVDIPVYESFKRLLELNQMTVTEAIKALIAVYDEETAILSTAFPPRM